MFGTKDPLLKPLSRHERKLVVHLTELEEDQQVVNDAIPSLSVEGLHAFCCRLNWAGDLQSLMTALDQPHCDRATALAIYWLSSPDEWAGNDDIDEYQRPTYDVFQKAQDRLIANDFTNQSIDFDIRGSLGGVDAYWDAIAANPHIPGDLKPPAKSG
jgi:hypothetical protein